MVENNQGQLQMSTQEISMASESTLENPHQTAFDFEAFVRSRTPHFPYPTLTALLGLFTDLVDVLINSSSVNKIKRYCEHNYDNLDIFLHVSLGFHPKQ